MKEYCLLFAWPQADETKCNIRYIPRLRRLQTWRQQWAEKWDNFLEEGGAAVGRGQGAGAAQSPAALFISRVAVIGRDPVDTWSMSLSTHHDEALTTAIEMSIHLFLIQIICHFCWVIFHFLVCHVLHEFETRLPACWGQRMCDHWHGAELLRVENETKSWCYRDKLSQCRGLTFSVTNQPSCSKQELSALSRHLSPFNLW